MATVPPGGGGTVPPPLPSAPSAQTQETLRGIITRIQQLKSQGHSVDSSTELKQLHKIVLGFQLKAQQQQQRLAQAAASTQDPSTSTNPDSRSPSPPIVSFTPEQVASLKCQIVAFKLLSRNQPIPPQLQLALSSPPEAIKFVQKLPAASTSTGSGGSNGAEFDPQQEFKVAQEEKQRLLAQEDPLEQVEDPSSIVYPFNSFLEPKQILTSTSTSSNDPISTSRTTLLIPTLLPKGLDAQTILDERNRYIEARIQQRIRELQDLPSNLSQSDLSSSLSLSTLDSSSPSSSSSTIDKLSSAKIRALIELKSLSLLSRQKTLRESLVTSLQPSTSLLLPIDRTLFRRGRKQSLRDAKTLEQLEKKQKLERELKTKQKHLDHLQEIVDHGVKMMTSHRGHQSKFGKLGKSLLKFHTEAEKEEAKRVERVSKERLKALRADDEEGYLKLIDTAKDTRITHLLRQTDTFLDSLATAVAVQQNDAIQLEQAASNKGKGGGAVVSTMEGGTNQEEEPETVDETRFGAQPVFEEEGEGGEKKDKDKVDYYNVAHKIKETVSAQPSILVGGELKGYQLKGLEWMVSLYNNHVNGILADEMGLGKTVQTLALITYLIEHKKQPGPYLVIVPLSTMPNWISEFERWAPSVRVVSYKGTPTQRKSAQHEIRQGNFQVLLTTYEYIIKDRPLLAKIKWLHMIIDEGHRMKNAESKLSLTLTTYYSSRYRLILTGTPLQNNLPELWALLNFVLPKIFGSVKSFDEWFNAPFANTGGQDKIEINEEESLLIIRRLHKVLRPFLLRRLKKDVESDLPDKVERVIKCKMSSLQLKLTRQIKEHGMIFTEMGKDDDNKKKATGIKGLQNQIMQLRKICNHPFCFEAVERSIDPTGLNNATLYRVAGKFELLDRILPKLFATGHRVLMFFQMTTVMTIFEDYLNFRRIQHLRLDGTTKHEDRSSLLKLFNEPNSQYPIFILSTRAGGLGLNLQTADTVIIFDSDWNPHQDLQAQDRAHRIGQKKEVRILRLVTERSVEEHVMAGAAKKIEMDKKIIQAGRYDNKSTAEERDAFLRALLEADDEEKEDDDDADEADILNEAIARTEEERQLFRQMDLDRRKAEESAWFAAGNTGKFPERLIQEYELPEVYRMEHQKAVVEPDEQPEGSTRRRKEVMYDDGMTEEQWLQTMEEDEDEAGGRKTRGARKSKAASVKPSESGFSDSGDDNDSKKRGRENEDTASSAGGGKRRKVQLSPYQQQLANCFELILTEMENLDNPTYGHQCTGLFNELPNKRDYADYYLLIRNPISLKEIKKKISKGLYPDCNAFANDIYLMLQNAMTYNDEGSIVYQDTLLLRQVFDQAWSRFVYNGQPVAVWQAHQMQQQMQAQAPAQAHLQQQQQYAQAQAQQGGYAPPPPPSQGYYQQR
ncbi:uncharacterized protein JCM6883_005730 [Sporobolomyces salmoneus]|uniref:uncharacterized protein n=1 Tax=Sporobolomyces salmoneus TaxID=183962 RepID=UPI0031785BB2